jgi:hypothetical protein
MNAEDFEREKKRLMSQREARERFSQEAEEEHTRKRGLEEDALAGAGGKRMLMGGSRCRAARGLPAPSAPSIYTHMLPAPCPSSQS